MIQISRSTLLVLVYIGGLSIVQVAATYTCKKANDIGCASCGKIALCDANLKATETSCGSGKVCGYNSSVTPITASCYTLAKPEVVSCYCGTGYPGYKKDFFDPNKYLMCVSKDVQYPLSCATGLIFDESVKKCVPPPTGPPTTTLPPVSCTAPGFFGHGCNAYYGCFTDPSDESKLMATEIINCGGDQVFDASIPGCDTEANVTALYEPFKCEGTAVAQMDSVECNAFHICMVSGPPEGEKICCNAGERFDSTSMLCVPASQVPDENCPQVNECVASKLSFNCSAGLITTSSTTISTISSVSSSSSSLSSTSSSFSSSIPSSSSSSSTSSLSSSSSTSSLSSSSSASSLSSSSSTSSLSSSSSIPSSIISTTSTTTTGTAPICSADGAFPYPGDCSKYYWCSGGKSVVQSCPSKMLFDKVKHYCNVASSVVC